jgi:hypothetical protein
MNGAQVYYFVDICYYFLWEDEILAKKKSKFKLIFMEI